jgi:hypothetical protein
MRFYTDGSQLTAKFEAGSPIGGGCMSTPDDIQWCGLFNGKNKKGYFLPSGVAMRQVFRAGEVVEKGFYQLDEDGLPEGYGVSYFLVDSDINVAGTRYEGQVKNGARNGYGVAYFPDGTRYEGQWQERIIQGFGRKVASDGQLLAAGFWQNGQLQGSLGPTLQSEK